MPEGPAKIERPFVTTNLKYNVLIIVDEDIYENPPKATELLGMRVNAPQKNSNGFIKQKAGEVIMAANDLAHPSRIELVDEEVERSSIGGIVNEGDIGIDLTYIIQGVGVGEFANTSTTSRNMWNLHEVLVKENDEPISGSSVQREWNPHPYEVQRVSISTE